MTRLSHDTMRAIGISDYIIVLFACNESLLWTLVFFRDGQTEKPLSTYRLMTGVVIRLGDADETENMLLKILGTVLSNKKNAGEKIDVLKEYGIPVTPAVERSVGNMYSLADVIAEEAAEKAAEGQKEKDMLTAIKNLMKNLKLTVEQAMDALSIPQEKRQIYAGRVQNG